MPSSPARTQGFTLVELILVIVVLGIISVGGTQFIVNSVEGYRDSAIRERQGSTAKVAVEKITRELRDALPNSARNTDDYACIEFIPTLGGSIYTSMPLIIAASEFSSVPYISGGAPSIGRVAVYPLRTSEVYSPASTSADASSISPPLAGSVVSADLEDDFSEVSIEFERAHRFPLGSPQGRWFMVSDPVSFCIDATNRLFRYSNYGFIENQPTSGSFDTLDKNVSNGRSLLALGVSGQFTVEQATLQRNALVQLDLDFREAGEGLRVIHEVQLRNVP
ncbi:MAG: MSHA biogenesis protein MshO [Motiliproteus sp.]|jgi:MSHA biogenesis protein MshO